MFLPVKLWLRRLVEFACVLALLLAPWPGLGRAFCGGFCDGANAFGLERELDSGLSLRLDPARSGDLGSERAHASWHALLRVEHMSSHRATRLAFNTRSTTYVPWAAFVAFALVSRAWTRKRAALAITCGALLTLGFSVLALALSTLRFLALPRVGGLELSDGSRALLDALFMAWIVPPGMAYAAPLLAGSLMLWLSRSRPPAPSDSSAGAPLPTGRRDLVIRRPTLARRAGLR